MTTPHPGPKCGAKKRQGEGFCGLAAGWGTDHVGEGKCKLHGGSMGNHRKKAAKAKLERDMKTLGIPVNVPPAQGLLEEIARTLGEMMWLRSLIIESGERDPEELFVSRRELTRTEDGPLGVTTVQEAERSPAAAVVFEKYLQWKTLYCKEVALALANNIAERQIDMAERMADLHGQLVAAALDGAGATGEARAAGLQAARERFLALSA